MTLQIDERLHAVALLAAAEAALRADGGDWHAYDLDEVPADEDLPAIFAVVQIERRHIESLRAGGVSVTAGWRAVTTTVARSLDEVRWAMWKVASALEDHSLTIGADPEAGRPGTPSTPFQMESSDGPARREDGWYSAVAVWTYITT